MAATAVAGSTVGVSREERDTRVGRVLSDKGEKTCTVSVDRLLKHRKYGKYYRRSTKLRVHDEKNEAREGDIVEVMSCRRLSKTKCWRLVRVVSAAGL